MDLVDLTIVNVTPKIHTIFHHVTEFCGQFGALGRYSKQASESVHADFKKTFRNYKVASSHDCYDTYLLRAVMDYNCGHL